MNNQIDKGIVTSASEMVSIAIIYVQKNISNDYAAIGEDASENKEALEYVMNIFMFCEHGIKKVFENQNGLEDIQNIVERAVSEIYLHTGNGDFTTYDLSDILGKMITENNGMPEASKEEVELLLVFLEVFGKKIKEFLADNIK